LEVTSPYQDISQLTAFFPKSPPIETIANAHSLLPPDADTYSQVAVVSPCLALIYTVPHKTFPMFGTFNLYTL